MGDHSTPPQHASNRVLTSQQDVRRALADRLVENWDNGDPAANDDLIAELGAWRRRNRYSSQEWPR